MAKYRQIETKFWSDSKVIDEMAPQDRYFYLYLLTNEKSNQVGCYEISKNQMSRDTGYDIKIIGELLKKFEDELDLIIYDNETKEVFIKNWYKYNWLNSSKTAKCIIQGVLEIKSKLIIPHISPLLENYLQNMGYGRDIFEKNLQNMPHGSNKEKEKEEEEEKEEIKEKQQEKEQEELYDPFR